MALLKVPVPDVVQEREENPDAVAPVIENVLPSQIVLPGPALAWAASLMVSSIWLTTSEQGDNAKAVSVRKTDPVSPGPGVYTGFIVFAPVRVPDPE